MKPKNTHRACNWSEYNKNLVSRGSIKVWISPEAASSWKHKGKRSPGGIKKYSDLAIKVCLIVKEVYKLSLRQCEGFIRSLSELLSIDEVPHYTTICRRMSELDFNLLSQLPNKKGLHILIDSTGLKIYGEGEWIRKKHGASPYSLWTKLHVAVDHTTQKIISVKRSDAHGYDSKYFEPLLTGLGLDIACIYGDGAYDKRICYQAAHRLNAQLIAPVQRNARKQKANRDHPYDESLDERDRQIDFINAFEDKDLARALWKKVSQYHKRSLVETAMYRLKQNFGHRINSRRKDHQQKQMEARAFALNKMTDLGIPSQAGS